MTDRDAVLARKISLAAGLRPTRITAVSGLGTVNRVFLVDSGGSRSVVRFAIDPLRPSDFEVEEWCLEKASAQGIPSPQVIARGTHQEAPYLIQTFIAGEPGTQLRPLDAWRILGEYARAVQAIPISNDAPDQLFSRFGRNLPMAWQAHLEYNVDQLVGADPLLRLGVYPLDGQPRLRRVLRRLQSTEIAFGLSHGDLSPRNLVVPGVGPPVLIDWGSASAGLAPYDDLLAAYQAHHASGDPAATELAAFVSGPGGGLDELEPILHDLSILKALDLVRWAIEQRPDRLVEIAASSREWLQRTMQW